VVEVLRGGIEVEIAQVPRASFENLGENRESPLTLEPVDRRWLQEIRSSFFEKCEISQRESERAQGTESLLL